MSGIFRTLLFLSLILCACSLGKPSPESAPPALAADSPVPASESPNIKQGPDGASTVSPSYPGGCGYQWAYQDLPELSSDFLGSLQASQPEAQGNAYAFGENCMGADGSVIRFIPMETDFNITLHVNDLSNESELGEWIVKVMQVFETIPPDQIIGPRPGRVSIVFQSSGEQKAANFYVDQYQGLSPGLSHAEIYQSLQTK